MPSPAKSRRQAEPEQYPALPTTDGSKPEEVAKATNVSFAFPNKVFNRPWTRLLGAELDRENDLPSITFLFGDLKAVAVFPKDSKYCGECWQSYLDGRLSSIEQKPEVCTLYITFQDDSEEFEGAYPTKNRQRAPARPSPSEAEEGDGPAAGSGQESEATAAPADPGDEASAYGGDDEEPEEDF